MGAPDASFVLERSREAGHGDLATNLAMVIARARRTNPRAVAAEILEDLRLPEGMVSRTEVAGPGFINFWLAETQLSAGLTAIIRGGERFGRAAFGAGQRVNVEFVSANPTGPLHVGHGRGAALGDAIAALLEFTGHAVTREFYINDAGVQIDRLVESLWARIRERRGESAPLPEGGYHGEYLIEAAARAGEELAPAVLAGSFEAAAPALRRFFLALERAEQDELLRDFGVRFDRMSSEQAMYEEGRVAAALAELDA